MTGNKLVNANAAKSASDCGVNRMVGARPP